MRELILTENDYAEMIKTVNSPGWEAIQKVFESHAERIIGEMTAPLVSVSRIEYKAGEIHAYRDCMDLPRHEIEKFAKGRK